MTPQYGATIFLVKPFQMKMFCINSDYYFKVASVFEEQLQTEQGEGFTEKQLSPLMSILMQHWPCQDEASDLVVNSWPWSCLFILLKVVYLHNSLRMVRSGS